MAFWTCRETAASSAYVHEFDEYMVVVRGCYALTSTRGPSRRGYPAWMERNTAFRAVCCMAVKLRVEPEPSTHLADVAPNRERFTQ